MADQANLNPRWIALQVLMKVIGQGRSLDDVFNSRWFQELKASRRDLSFSRELSNGICRWYDVLLPLVNQRLKKPLRARDLDVEIILLLGFYQLLVIKTDAHAAVNETVKLAKMQKKPWARGLTNAILRQILRDKLDWETIDQSNAYPDWMQTRIRSDWGDLADQVLQQGNLRAPMTLRVDLQQLSRDDYIEQLGAAEIPAAPHATVETAIELESPVDVGSLPGFDQGVVSVQDAAAQIAATLLPCEPGYRVLDSCAAPGGKTIHLLQQYPDIQLDALDQSESRLEKVRQNLERTGKTAQLLTGDAVDSNGWFEGEKYDCMLIDAPCSASGVIRRHPDIKLLRRETDIMSLAGLQREIMNTAWQLLKPGGLMLYSTCSIFKDENENQIAGFLSDTGDCEELPLDHAKWGSERSNGRQILPGEDKMDGFYYALLRKKGDS